MDLGAPAALNRLKSAMTTDSDASPTPKPRNYVPAGLAVGLLVVIGIATYMRLSVHGYRQSEDSSQAGSSQTTSLEPAPGAELAAPPTHFSWPAQAGATSYVVRLRDGSGTLIWRSDPVSTATATLPASLAFQISPGRTYLWSIVVSSEADVSELGPWSFRLK
jgi:hypothetical protein